jgi:hypothetical protein
VPLFDTSMTVPARCFAMKWPPSTDITGKSQPIRDLVLPAASATSEGGPTVERAASGDGHVSTSQ